jgi:arabinan endo-1,5-alpha-L-arabinosidase
VVPGGGTVQSCADPTVFHGQRPGDRHWYMFCTTDPLNDAGTAGRSSPDFHPVPMMRSLDLVHWRYVGDALTHPPSWAASDSFFWAPDVIYSRTFHRYYLTFVVTDTDESVSGEPGCTSDSAIGVATSTSPTGPWQPSDRPVVAPRRAGPGCDFYWTYDPDVLGNAIGRHGILYYGSYYGGIFGRRVALTRSGMAPAGKARQIAHGEGSAGAGLGHHSVLRATGTPRQTTIPNRYEGSNVIRHGGWYYLFASATNCCNGPLTGYSVFVGRSRHPFGPYVDRYGNSLLAGRVGGTPALSMNGNRWVGTGHNSVFRDFGGQWWTVYHAVDRHHPYFADQPGFTKRPPMLDPVDWVHGWPTVRDGRWASDRAMPAPAAQPGEVSAYRPVPVAAQQPGAPLAAYSDDFDGSTLSSRWTWVRPPASSSYGVGNGLLRFDTQAADLNLDSNNASVLTEPAPSGDYVVQTKVHLDVPAEGCCHNYVQAGLVVYGNDDAYLKLAHVSIWETRQTEFAKEVPTAPQGSPRYGNTVVGPPADETYLRIVKQSVERAGEPVDEFTAYTSQDGSHWVRGGTWTHDRLGSDVRIGLVSMGGSGFTARFDYVRAWALDR